MAKLVKRPKKSDFTHVNVPLESKTKLTWEGPHKYINTIIKVK